MKKMSSKAKETLLGCSILAVIIVVIIWLGVYVFPDKVASRNEIALIVGAGVEY